MSRFTGRPPLPSRLQRLEDLAKKKDQIHFRTSVVGVHPDGDAWLVQVAGEDAQSL